MFGLQEFQPAFAGAVVVGHDTAEIANRVISELSLQNKTAAHEAKHR
jgi:hypothetical protein